MEEKRVITDAAEIYVYFELVKRLAPKTMLDFGMFLKRIGATARQAMNCEIPGDVRLNAVDLFPEVDFPIYRKIYDSVVPLDVWDGGGFYDLVSFFSVNEFLTGQRKKRIWEKLPDIAGCVIADTRDPEFVQFLMERFRAEAVETDGKTYAVAYRK